jgi:FkbM family methyltransferase
MNKALVSISRSGLVRSTFRGLRLHRFYNAWLHRHPRTKVLPGSGIVYRARRTESVSLALEILEGGNCYDGSLLPEGFSTFADLGCNVGYFAVWLASKAGGRPIKGIMVDANPEVVSEARWHVQANGWKDVEVVQGVVGVPKQGGVSDFYVYEADTCSTAELVEIQMDHRDKFTKISVPVISLSENWRRKFQNTRCHILKIDIEGAELAFLKSEPEFLRLVDMIYVEWHSYKVTYDELNEYLESQGFRMQRIIEHIGPDPNHWTLQNWSSAIGLMLLFVSTLRDGGRAEPDRSREEPLRAANSFGVRYPRELCGRKPLYSKRHCSMIT